MDIQKIHQYKSAFDAIAKEIKDDEGNAIEVWYARELQQVLGYARWENFVVAVGRAVEACKTMGINVDDHFREVTKMVQLGSGSERGVQDFMLTRYASAYTTMRSMDELYANLDENCIPREIINMDVADYHSFLEARRKLMAQKVKAYFNAL